MVKTEKLQPSVASLPDTCSSCTAQKFVAGVISLLLTIVSTVAGFFLIAKNMVFQVDTVGMQKILAVPQLEYLKPEPLEKALFLFGVITMPILLAAFYGLSYALIQKKISEENINKLYVAFSYGVSALAGMLVCLDCWGDKYYFFGKSVGTDAVWFVLTLLVTFASWLLVGKKGNSTYLIRILTAISCISVVIIAVFCVYDVNSISHTGVYVEHFNAVFHAVVQVCLGKELLVDLPHQYGMYPHFIEPIFKIVGLSVLKFTAVMGFMMGVSLWLIYQFIKEISDNGIVARLGFCALVYYGYIFLRVNFQFDQYFQYHPIRFIFPALSIFLTHKYLKTNDKRLYYLSFFVYSAAIFWNFDTGFVVYMSWLLLLLFTEVRGLNVKNMLSHVAHGVLLFLVFASAFTAYMYLRYGNVPDYRSFFDYQKIFYSYGYAMLPMDIIGPWHLVILAYLVGILYSIASIAGKEQKDSPKVSMIFFLSILGTGIFSYFQGRSHDLNLASVCYPAIIIVTLFADSLLPIIKIENRLHHKVAFAGILFFLIVSTASLVKNLPAMAANSVGRVGLALSGKETPYVRKTEFIKNVAPPGQELLILSSLSSIYYLASGTTCPVKIPGPTELFLKDEYQSIYDYLQSDRCKLIVFDGDFVHSNPHKRKLLDYIAKYFGESESMPEGMYVLVKH